MTTYYTRARRARVPFSSLALAAALLSAACATAPAGHIRADGVVDGAYQGRLEIEGRPYEAALLLRARDGGRVEGTLRVLAPFAFDAVVRGVVIDDLLRITATYGDDAGCDGRMEGILDVASAGAALEGPVTVTDCGGPVAGRMSFAR